MKQIFLLFLALQLILNSINSQEVTQENYKRAVSFMYDNYNNKTVFNLNTKVNWFKDSSGLWFKIIGNAAHMTMIDQPEKMAKAVGSFLRSVDNN
jgi:hypothetical protein